MREGSISIYRRNVQPIIFLQSENRHLEGNFTHLQILDRLFAGKGIEPSILTVVRAVL